MGIGRQGLMPHVYMYLQGILSRFLVNSKGIERRFLLVMKGNELQRLGNFFNLNFLFVLFDEFLFHWVWLTFAHTKTSNLY